jgi:energy-coupling factor transporter ATP-binding protein EcfA2
MDLNEINGFTLRNLSALNVILGKNGCGKSHLLKQIESGLQGRAGFGRIRYISPERGGSLEYQPNIDQAIGQDPNWMANERRKNQSQNFRQQSATLFRRLELLVLREIERTHTQPGYVPRNFGTTLDKLNTLLERVRLERDAVRAFKILERNSNNETSPDRLSSGESELISLGIEFLAFIAEADAESVNILLVDEPDVHLHPDLQDRLARFVVDALADQPVTLILATHSTALLAAMAEKEYTRVSFVRAGMNRLDFKSVTDVDRKILPIFGAHPLSNIFNQAPILLLEGEDDERVWQQAVRSSAGRIRLFPCVIDGLPHFAEFETEVSNVVSAVYDDARAFSLRDRDAQPELINDIDHVRRMRLSCRAAENLMLSDEVLAAAGTNWNAMSQKIALWIEKNQKHQYHSDMAYFEASGLDRKNSDLKEIRNLLVGLISNKPWEVLVGQTIASLRQDSPVADGHMREFLGQRVCQDLLHL